MSSAEVEIGAFGFEQAVEAIAVQSRRLAEAVAMSDLDAIVPSCPGWSVRDLAHHIGRGQSFWSENVRAKTEDVMSEWTSDPYPEDSDLPAWLGSCTYSLLRALRDTGPDAPCWTWWPHTKPHTSGAVARHHVQEVAVHRWDAELASAGLPGPLPAAVATDGVAEFLDIMLGSSAATLTGQVTLKATDTGDSWRIRAFDVPEDPDDLDDLERPDGPDQATRWAEVRAAVSDLVLVLYRRLPIHDAFVRGDLTLVASLLSGANTE